VLDCSWIGGLRKWRQTLPRLWAYDCMMIGEPMGQGQQREAIAMRIVVTGGSGKGGRWVVRELREHGHDVLTVDLVHDGSPHGQCVLADLTDLGQCHELLAGADAVVHFAAIPAPGIRPEGETFRNNAISTYNVFAAAADLGVSRVVWASSETVLGLPFDDPPAFAPVDETHPPRPESSYALSKLVGETLADQDARRSGTPFLGLRISNIMEPHDYARFESWQDDPQVRRWNLWSYVDARDVAMAVRLGIEADLHGAEIVILAAADSCMRRDSADLMAEVYPTVPLRSAVTGRQTLLSIERARRILGYEPQHSWLDAVG
jgi:nucleoside-diphosphate-sugar epimerase